jgi:hypothetical protein
MILPFIAIGLNIWRLHLLLSIICLHAMRNFILAFVLISLPLVEQAAQAQVPSTAKSVALPSATTQEEYNYATKGLKVQRANGLDMKSGYTLSTPTTMKMGTYTVTIEDLVRKADGTVACSVLQVLNATWPPVQGYSYLCIPNPGSPGEIWTQYNQAQQQYSSLDIMRAVSYALSARLSAMTAGVAGLAKNSK